MIAIVVAFMAVVLAAVASLIRLLARRVVGVEPRRKTLTVRRVGDDIEMPKSALTLAAGSYGLWFGERFEHHALIGPVVASDGHRVIRRVLKTTAPISTEPFEAQWTGHVMSGPAEIDPRLGRRHGATPRRGTRRRPGSSVASRRVAPWVIHVQGIRTSRLVTLRSVEVAKRAGLTSLVITYRGSGDGPPASASTLGQREWSDLADAIAYARSRGAASVYVVAWSMGAGLALELLRREPEAFDRLALIAPATNWRRIIRRGVKQRRSAWVRRARRDVGAGLPARQPADRDAGAAGLRSARLGPEPSRSSVPTIVVHSRGRRGDPLRTHEGVRHCAPERHARGDGRCSARVGGERRPRTYSSLP